MLRLLFLVAGFSLILFTPARAQDADLTYEIYAGGMHVLDAHLTMDLSAKSYHAAVVAKTQGFLGALVPWSGSFDSVGTRAKAGYRIRTHKSVSTWKGSDDIALYQYKADGSFAHLTLTDGGKDKTPKDVDPALTKGTTDILTATLNMMQKAGQERACADESAIFDSRRRFRLIYKDKGSATLPKSRYGLYSGPAMTCTAEVVPDGGAWHKKPRGWLSIQEQGRKQGTLPTLWVAGIDPALPPVPVKIMVKTNYGTLFMHLTRAQVGSRIKTAEK